MLAVMHGQNLDPAVRPGLTVGVKQRPPWRGFSSRLASLLPTVCVCLGGGRGCCLAAFVHHPTPFLHTMAYGRIRSCHFAARLTVPHRSTGIDLHMM